MIHDPMCPQYDCWLEGCTVCDECALIVRVREDESTKWIEFYNAEIEKQGAQWEASRRQYYRSGSDDGKALALDAAREAVAEMHDIQPSWWKSMFFGGRRWRHWCQYGWDWGKRDALAAIDALREGEK